MPEEYTYAVARIHTKENSMLSAQDLERMLSVSGFDEALAVLAEKGFDTLNVTNSDGLVSREREKTYKLISEMVEDMSVFDVFFYENDFQNLKAAVKAVITKDKAEKIFVGGGTVDHELIKKAIEKREFSELPEFLRAAAEASLKCLMETGDGGLCDVIIDKAYLEAVLVKSRAADNQMIKKYAELLVALADIRIAVRGARLGKSIEFFKRSLAECQTISVSTMAQAAAKGTDELYSYLLTTDYSGVADILKESYVAFEKWCDDRMMEEIRKERFNQFTIAPLAAYILARETELKMVGLILTAKQNKLDTSVIKERLRELYV